MKKILMLLPAALIFAQCGSALAANDSYVCKPDSQARQQGYTGDLEITLSGKSLRYALDQSRPPFTVPYTPGMTGEAEQKSELVVKSLDGGKSETVKASADQALYGDDTKTTKENDGAPFYADIEVYYKVDRSLIDGKEGGEIDVYEVDTVEEASGMTTTSYAFGDCQKK